MRHSGKYSPTALSQSTVFVVHLKIILNYSKYDIPHKLKIISNFSHSVKILSLVFAVKISGGKNSTAALFLKKSNTLYFDYFFMESNALNSFSFTCSSKKFI